MAAHAIPAGVYHFCAEGSAFVRFRYSVSPTFRSTRKRLPPCLDRISSRNHGSIRSGDLCATIQGSYSAAVHSKAALEERLDTLGAVNSQTQVSSKISSIVSKSSRNSRFVFQFCHQMANSPFRATVALFLDKSGEEPARGVTLFFGRFERCGVSVAFSLNRTDLKINLRCTRTIHGWARLFRDSARLD